MAIRVCPADESDCSAWAAYVAGHAGGTLFHTPEWRDAVRDAFQHDCFCLMARRDERVAGVFPLMRVASRLAGTILVSVPYAVYGGALCDDAQVREALLREARVVARRLRARWVDIRSMEPLHPQLPVIDRYVTFRKPLPGTPEEVLGTLPRKARAAARQARERFGLRVAFGDDQLDEVWRLYSQSMRRLASPNYPRAFFHALLKRTPGGESPGHLVQMVYQADRPIAGLVSFVHGRTLLPYFSGCDERFEQCHPNNYLYLTAMERGVALGCREFDFGRSRRDNTGSYNFKCNQGFEPTPLGYQYLTVSGNQAPDLHPASPKVRLVRKVWPKLPLAVTRPLGAWLARSIPG